MEAADQPSVLALVAADRLPGQPAPDPLLVSGPARNGLAETATLVLTDGAGQIHGTVHVALRSHDHAGLIGWLHAREDFEALAVLIAAARARLGPVRMLYAGTGPTQPYETATHALPGIAEHHRATTTRALRAAGFTPATSRLYLHRPLMPSPAQPHFPLAEVRPLTDPPGAQLTLLETDGSALATAVLHSSDDDHWLLWHLAVRADHRHRGIGSNLLAQCVHIAHLNGATSLIAHTDKDDHASVGLLTHAGFTTIDTLTIHHRRPHRESAATPPR
ncbi:GNAT family N-acetyltransferase [Streptomyces sp. NPDC126514]|uniref:GNAT family N-acetyltransferase n=1 Tax=Streptomyces sp. NPDC126514 TaxID=3155210 RepID=UPI00332571FB